VSAKTKTLAAVGLAAMGGAGWWLYPTSVTVTTSARLFAPREMTKGAARSKRSTATLSPFVTLAAR
jgi:hypothetical protein